MKPASVKLFPGGKRCISSLLAIVRLAGLAGVKRLGFPCFTALTTDANRAWPLDQACIRQPHEQRTRSAYGRHYALNSSRQCYAATSQTVRLRDQKFHPLTRHSETRRHSLNAGP